MTDANELERALSSATVDLRQWAFEAHAHRIGLRAPLMGLRRRAGGYLRVCRCTRSRDAKQHGAGQNPAGEGSVANFQHIRPLRADPRG